MKSSRCFKYVVVTMFACMQSSALLANCAVAVAGGKDNCDGFKGRLDLSGCPESASQEKPVVSCADGKAQVSINAGDKNYAADFSLIERYGARSWFVASTVRVEEGKAAKIAATKPEKKSTIRTPDLSSAKPKNVTPPTVKLDTKALTAASAQTPVSNAAVTNPPAAETQVEADAPSQKQDVSERNFKFNYDVSFSHSDNGFDKVDDQPDPAATTSLGQTAFLGFDGKFEDITFQVYMNLLSSSPELKHAFEVAKASKTFNDHFTASAGRNYLNVGGWENKNWGFATIFVSSYAEKHLTFADVSGATSATVMQGDFNFNKFGNLSLQLTNDVLRQTDDKGALDGWEYFNSSSKQPVSILEWSGTYGPMTPLLQFASYDLNHSQHIAAGFKVDHAGVVAYFDFIQDTRAKKTEDGSKKKEVFSNIVAEITYGTETLTPFVKYTHFNAVQPDTDHKGNLDSDSFDDNSQIWMVGSNLNTFGPYFAPYAAFIHKSADILEDTTGIDAKAKEGKKSSTFVLGVGGSL